MIYLYSIYLVRKNDLADEAINALRATVDFSKTKLRKVETNKKTMADDVLDESFKPSEFENLLIQIKGKNNICKYWKCPILYCLKI